MGAFADLQLTTVEFLPPPASAIAGASGVALDPMIVKLKQVDREEVRIIVAMGRLWRN